MSDHTSTPRLVMGFIHVMEPSGKGYTPDDDAVIHIDGDEDSEIRVNCPGAPRLASQIVKACNAHEALERALRGISEFPITDTHNNMDAVNMKLMAIGTLLDIGFLKKNAQPATEHPSANGGTAS